MSTDTPHKILVVDDERDMLNLLIKVLVKKCNSTVVAALSADQAWEMMKTEVPDVVLTDIKMPGMSGLEFLQQLNTYSPAVTTLLMTGYGTIEMAVQALKEGAYDFIEKPFDNERVIHAVNRAIERTRLLRENIHLHNRLDEQDCIHGFIGRSRRLQQTVDLLHRVAPSSITVLIRGESGTGKELAARALHAMSPRANRPMITVNCPALPEHILESELFGYRKGAFTGAERDKTGLFVEADGSTLLLDEIADIPVTVQTKLLRVLQEKEVQPLGQNKTYRINVRVIASTNQDLEAKIRRGTFREDLYYRLNAVTVNMPSLASMIADIPLLAQSFLECSCKEHGRENMEFTADALQYLIQRHWPGNIRELQNVISRAVLLCQNTVIGVADLSEYRDDNSLSAGSEAHEIDLAQWGDLPYKEAKRELLERFNATYLSEALRGAGGNVTAAARSCGMERQAFQRLMRQYDIESRKYR